MVFYHLIFLCRVLFQILNILIIARFYRKSAAWVEHKKNRRKRKKHNLNAHFDDNSIYRRGGHGRKKVINILNKYRVKHNSREIRC